MRIVVATSNRGKLSELRSLLPESAELVTIGELGLTLPDETGSDFVENALIKARAATGTDLVGVADDSGLIVDALGGAPGIFSARFAGEHATDEQNNCKLTELLAGLGPGERIARFCSAVAMVTPDGKEFVATGRVEGAIVDDPRGTNGFGYDPHFEIDDPDAAEFNGLTMAEISLEQKNRISHRARAYRNLLKQLERSRLFSGTGAFARIGGENGADVVGRR